MSEVIIPSRVFFYVLKHLERIFKYTIVNTTTFKQPVHPNYKNTVHIFSIKPCPVPTAKYVDHPEEQEHCQIQFSIL